jgi:superfamily I DNA/RNA helicase
LVAGVADQIIPGIAPKNVGEAERVREEQRRLLYVSVTRAKRELVISWPTLMEYRDAINNKVRIDQMWTQGDGSQVVKLGRTALLPDIPHRPITGARWLKAKLED